MSLTDVKIRQAKPRDKAYKMADGGGLYVEVKANGVKSWRYRYRIGKAENIYAVANYPDMGIAEARRAHQHAVALVRQGIHPAHQRAQSKALQEDSNANTFKSLAAVWIESRRSNWSAYYATQVESYFARDVYPKIGKRPIRSVTAPDVLAIIEAIAGRGAHAAAINVRQWISAVFRFAVARLKADADPAAALRGVITRQPIENAKAMDAATIAAFVRGLETFGGHRRTAIALHLMLLSFPRTIELRKMTFPQVDLTHARWNVPAENMKMGRRHIVPLSTQAIVLLRELKEITGAVPWAFPNSRRPREMMSGTTVNRALEHMGFSVGAVTGHDFRATASTHLHEMGFRSELVEMQLGHAKTDKTAAAYNHALYLPERAEMMQRWADWIDATVKATPPPAGRRRGRARS